MSEGPGEETTVVVDTREPIEVKMLSLNHPDVDKWLEEELDAADLVVNGVGFERKTPSDFASSLIEGRLDEQVEKLLDVYDSAKILIEGGFDDFSSLPHTSINAESLRGKAASIDMRYGVPVVPTGGSTGTETAQRLLVDMAIRYGRKATEDPVSDYLNTGSVGLDEAAGKRMWGCLSGVGPQRASDLYDEFGTPVEFISTAIDSGATEEELLMSVDGIGNTTAVDIAIDLWEAESDG